MRHAVTLAIALVGAAACSGGDEPAATAPPPPPSPVALVDAAVPPDGITAIAAYDPSSGLHLDDDTPGARRTAGATVHAHRTLEILLRSTPSGATVAVDGVIIGQTPNYWEGDFTGREREFTFVMPGYAMARYRFVPTTNGVVHGRLTKILDQDTAPIIPKPAGSAGPPPPAPPSHPPAAPTPPPAPVAPPDAAAAPAAAPVVDAGAPAP